MANVKLYAVMRTMRDEEYQELHEAIEHMSEKAGKAYVYDGTQTEVDGRRPGTLRKTMPID